MLVLTELREIPSTSSQEHKHLLPLDGPFSADDAGDEFKTREEDSRGGHDHHELLLIPPAPLGSWLRDRIWLQVHFLRNYLGLDEKGDFSLLLDSP